MSVISRPADLGVRATLVVAAAVAVVVGAPTWARTALVAAAAVAVGEWYVRRHRDGGRDAAIEVTAGALLLLLGVGLVLALLPGAQLTRPAWGVATGIAALGVLAATARRAPRERLPSRGLRPQALWFVAAGALVVAGLGISVAEVRTSQVAPVELSAVRGADGVLTVTVDASPDADAGPYDLRLLDPQDGDRVLREDFTVPAGGSLSEAVPAVRDDTLRIVLEDATTRASVRYVIVDPAG